MRSDKTFVGGEPSYCKYTWSILYLFLIALPNAALLFLSIHWTTVPTVFKVFGSLVILQFFVTIFFGIRCYLDKDAFLYDHPLMCYRSESCIQLIGLYSNAIVTTGSAQSVRRLFSWIIVTVVIKGRKRFLWLAPWFQNREEVVRLLTDD